MTAQPQQAPPDEAARAWAAANRERIDIVVSESGGVFYARAHGPHPLVEKTSLCLRVSGVDRAGAIRLARLELLGMAARIFAGKAGLAGLDQHVYDHGTLVGVKRVQAMVEQLRGEPVPTEREVGLAYVRLCTGGEATVGDVANAVMFQDPQGKLV